ncbi:hypothetical protein [Sinorhizobium meliloti]|uniref:hypothetical protein n=1 Tax=Rhizobium meliloti TaxID=382 RepID=UPI000B49E048|nr:hypothetical protein [Sinorhizobium meliloti]ASP50968.1 hypothetical protein CDO31_04895 [Sinorhizobium meliloti]
MHQEISLYLDLEKGKSADLEVVARAALAFNSAVKEVAFILDPSVEVRLELKSGDEGSLILNSIIRPLRGVNRNTLIAIALVVGGWLASDVRAYVVGEAIDTVVGEEALQLSDADKQDIADRVAKLLKSNVGKEQVNQMLESLEQDPAIKGVGVSPRHSLRPEYVLPRETFRERIEMDAPPIETAKMRSIPSVNDVTLVSPVLIPGSRKWKLRLGNSEFGAVIKDERFLARVLGGEEPIPMTAGIKLKVAMTTREERVNGVWRVKDYTVDEVLSITPAERPLDLWSPQQDG